MDYRDVFAWSYDDLKAYKGNIIQHMIPLKEKGQSHSNKRKEYQPQIGSTHSKGTLEDANCSDDSAYC
jgi:hypothetical protein